MPVESLTRVLRTPVDSAGYTLGSSVPTLGHCIHAIGILTATVCCLLSLVVTECALTVPASLGAGPKPIDRLVLLISSPGLSGLPVIPLALL